MREHLFRVWDAENKEMVYFGFGSVDDGNTFAGQHSIDITGANVMGYTGLKDMDGKDVYEGDILCQMVGGKPVRYSVYWEDTKAGFNIGRLSTEVARVSGNIYENPELLEKK